MFGRGGEWTRATAGPGPPRMCSIVELPNFLEYPGARGGLRCVFSRVYGEVGFFGEPVAGLLETQCPAHTFFAGPWALRPLSYTLLTIGPLGMGLFRDGDTAYLFDPHGLPEGTPAFIAKVRAGDMYPYLTYYTRNRPDVRWAGAMVFFVPSGPEPAAPADLTAAALHLYGASETYLQDEAFSERRVAITHPCGARSRAWGSPASAWAPGRGRGHGATPAHSRPVAATDPGPSRRQGLRDIPGDGRSVGKTRGQAPESGARRCMGGGPEGYPTHGSPLRRPTLRDPTTASLRPQDPRRRGGRRR